MRRLVVAALLAATLSGCGKKQPMLAGGRPVSHWLEVLKGPDAKQRKTAVTKLGNVGPADEAVLPALLGALKDPDAQVRHEAILALMKYGPGARDAMPELAELQRRDRDARVRSAAAKALEKLQADADPPE
ncbi:MAG TPA: HEAT repeat domain-containing protein [Gemmataceae bacterium]|nr:HEAT repeat domain-containing protein [Gemmataceae bacterium]